MKPCAPSVLDALGEALSVFADVLQRTWRRVLPVLVLIETVHALYRQNAMKGGVLPVGSFQSDRNVVTIAWMTVGLFAVVTVVRAALALCGGRSGDEEPHGGRAVTWVRLLGTTWLIAIVAAGLVVAGVIGMLAVGAAFRSPLASVGGGAVTAFVAFNAFIPLLVAIGHIVFFAVRWAFAPVLSVTLPLAGPSAMRESSAWVKGRFVRVFAFLVGAYLIEAGIAFPFGLIGDCALLGPSFGFPQLASPSAWWWTCAIALVGDFAALYLPVALLVFWLLIRSGSEAKVEPGRNRGIVLALLALGLVGWTFGAVCGVKASSLAREEKLAARQAKIDEIVNRFRSENGVLVFSTDGEKSAARDFAARQEGEVDGAALVAEFAGDRKWTIGLVSALQRELDGRLLTLARARVVGRTTLSNRPQAFVVDDATVHPDDHTPKFLLESSESTADMCADLTWGDVLTNVTARVVGLSERGSDPRALRLSLVGCGREGEVGPLPGFDAKTITGDELFALVENLPGGLRPSHFKELASRLAGRKLVFHDLRVRSSSMRYGRSPSDGVVRRAITFAKGRFGRSGFVAWFEGEELLKLAEQLSFLMSSTSVVRELTAVFPDVPESMVDSPSELCVNCVECKLVEPIPELPEFDPDGMTGEKIVELLKPVKPDYSPILLNGIVRRLEGRKLTFTDLKVRRVSKERNGLVNVTARYVYGKDAWRDSVSICARVKKSDLDALPWGFALDSPIARLTGTVGRLEDDSFGYLDSHEIPLADVTFEVAWANEKAPEVDVDAITGDGLVRLVAGFDTATREAKRERIFRRLEGRRLTFATAVVETAPTQVHGWMARQGRLAFGPDDATRAACTWPVEFGPGAAFDDLSKGQKLTNVSVTVSSSLAPRADAFPESFVSLRPGAALSPLGFKGVSCTVSDPPEPLPGFDAKTITGDELFALLAKRKTALSAAQLGELQTALAGRRLTFSLRRADIHGMTCENGAPVLSVHFPMADNRWSIVFVGEFALDGREFARLEDGFFFEASTKGKSITGTVAKPGPGARSDKLVFVQAEVEIDKAGKADKTDGE